MERIKRHSMTKKKLETSHHLWPKRAGFQQIILFPLDRKNNEKTPDVYSNSGPNFSFILLLIGEACEYDTRKKSGSFSRKSKQRKKKSHPFLCVFSLWCYYALKKKTKWQKSLFEICWPLQSMLRKKSSLFCAHTKENIMRVGRVLFFQVIFSFFFFRGQKMSWKPEKRLQIFSFAENRLPFFFFYRCQISHLNFRC